MIAAIIGLLLGLIIGAGCRLFDIPSPAPPRLIGACLLLAMTVALLQPTTCYHRGSLSPIASSHGGSGVVKLHQDDTISVALLERGETLR
jgi:XapX domain-containing protein